MGRLLPEEKERDERSRFTETASHLSHAAAIQSGRETTQIDRIRVISDAVGSGYETDRGGHRSTPEESPLTIVSSLYALAACPMLFRTRCRSCVWISPP